MSHENKFHLLGLALSGATLLLAFGASCSLTGVTKIDVGKCETDKECTDALNPDEGYYLECAAFECVNRQCQPIQDEVCDGFDNDCDYLIDEPPKSKEPLLSAQRSSFLAGVTEIVGGSAARSPAISQLFLQHADGKVSSVDPESGDLSTVKSLTHEDPGALSTTLVEGCYTAASASPGACNFNQTVVAGGERLAYFAHISSSTCSAGELRIGVLDLENEQTGLAGFIDRGPGFRNPAYRGVGTRGSLCSDNERSACRSAKDNYLALVADGASSGAQNDARDQVIESCGVSRPAIAAAESQALVAYLGAGLQEKVCGQEPVKVLGLVMHGRIGLRNGEFAWGDPSGDGAPLTLGTTTVGTPPALVAPFEEGFLLAHSTEDGKIRLAYVEKQQAPPVNNGTECPDDDCESRTDLEVPQLSGVQDLLTTPVKSAAGPASGIRIAHQTLDGGEVALALSWVEGCVDEEGEVEGAPAFVKILRLRPREGDIPEVLLNGPVIALGDSSAFPLSVPSRLPFLQPGLERNGVTAVEADQGGFFVITRPNRSAAIRISLFDGRPLIAGETIDVGAPTSRFHLALGQGDEDQFLVSEVESAEVDRATFTCSD